PLARYALDDGEPVGAYHELPAGEVRLARGLGSAQAVWTAADVHVPLALDAAGRLVAGPPITGVDLALPLSTTRALVCTRGVASLREGGSTRWTASVGADSRIVDGAILSDGRAAALVVQRAAARAVVVLGLRDGSLQHRINLDDVDAVQFAARRMLALVLAA